MKKKPSLWEYEVTQVGHAQMRAVKRLRKAKLATIALAPGLDIEQFDF